MPQTSTLPVEAHLVNRRPRLDLAFSLSPAAELCWFKCVYFRWYAIHRYEKVQENVLRVTGEAWEWRGAGQTLTVGRSHTRPMRLCTPH